MTLDRTSIEKTAQRIAPYVRRTPVMELSLAGAALPVTLKLEHLQHTGSFKARGAFSNLVGAKVPPAGVAAASGGNHGAAVAYAASVLGLPARIFVPSISSPAKVARIAGYGGIVVQGGANYQACLETCDAFVRQSAALDVHAYNTELTLLGPGTLAREFEEQAPGLDTILVAVGGGGLIGGMAGWHQSRVKLIGVEPETSHAMFAAMAAGRPVTVAPSGLAADSLGASSVGSLAFGLAQKHVERVLLVSDDDIREAQRHLWKATQMITEPGGAAALAALISGKYRPGKNERVGVIVCGANTPLDIFAALFAPA